jgi:hypothetical protein
MGISWGFNGKLWSYTGDVMGYHRYKAYNDMIGFSPEK